MTAQVGGDDIGFSYAVITCGILGLTDPMGAPCRNHYTSAGTDELAQAIARIKGRIAAVLQGIRARTTHPNSHGRLSGYSPSELNTMLAGTVASNGDIFVGTYVSSIGYDACSSSK